MHHTMLISTTSYYTPSKKRPVCKKQNKKKQQVPYIRQLYIKLLYRYCELLSMFGTDSNARCVLCCARSMASLYSNPDWSTNMDKAVLSLVSGQVQLEPALAWLSEKAQREYFSLSDVWGAVTAAGIMKQVTLPSAGNIIIVVMRCYDYVVFLSVGHAETFRRGRQKYN